MKISLSVPATIYDFGETKNLTNNKYVTHAKLSVFYVGQTGDKRVFKKQFSDQLLKTLPGTPVVAFFDEDSDDFKGHHIVQHIFGYVPENATIEYVEKEVDGQKVTFAVTDVLLFTGRKDNIGTIASKIVGHPHSLELDPQTVEYEVIRKNGAIESIIFKKADFIGLSVLGKNERPAFTGSTFFAEGSELDLFINSFKEFKEEVELYKSGGEKMETQTDLPIPKSYQDFKSSSLMEKIEKISEVLSQQGYYAYFVDAIGEDFIFRLYSEDSVDFYRLREVDGAITYMEVVYPRYLTRNEIDEMEAAPAFTETVTEETPAETEPEVVVDATENVVEDAATVEEVASENSETFEKEVKESDVEETEDEEEDNEDNLNAHIVVEAEVLKGPEDDKQTTTTAKQQEEVQSTQDANLAALDVAERQELNEYRKKAKFELIESYSELANDVREKFKQQHDQFTIEVLDKELAYELVKSQRQHNKGNGIRVFSINETVSSQPETLADKINRYKDKH